MRSYVELLSRDFELRAELLFAGCQGVDVAIGLHPLETVARGMADALRACLRRELPERLLLPPNGTAAVVDGLDYFTGDWADPNQTHYNPQFAERLTLSKQVTPPPF